jgi:hypothetical protein
LEAPSEVISLFVHATVTNLYNYSGSIYPNLKVTQPAKFNTTLPKKPTNPAIPIHVPWDRPTFIPPVSQPSSQPQGPANTDNDPNLELLHIPEINDSTTNLNMTSAEADRELRDLMSGGISTDVSAIDMTEARVKGLQDDILLLPHQVIGRAWMRERENTAEKRLGGILADDMG